VPQPLLSLVIALLALPGLLGRQASVVVHAHQGGADAHHHASTGLDRYIERGHDHGHRHDGGHHHSHGPASGGPHEDGQPLGNDHPDDRDQHGHTVDRTAPAIRRSLLVDDSGPRLPVPSLELMRPHEQPHEFVLDSECGERRGHPPARVQRVAARLVQGLGLLI
jgi:hypothetical protein